MKGKSGFQPGNKEQKKKIGMKYAPTKYRKEVGEQLVSMSPYYNECMESLRKGNGKLNAEQKEFMDRFEKMFEFARPKLARTELTGAGGEAISFQLIDNYASKNT